MILKTTIVRRLFATCAVASQTQEARGPSDRRADAGEVPGSAQDVNRPVHHEAPQFYLHKSRKGVCL